MREFLQQARDVEVAPPQSVLDSPLKSLQQSLDALEQRRSVISQKVQEVNETLTRVKQVHAAVKTEYNNALAHTSSAYPEVRRKRVCPGDVLNKKSAIRNYCLGSEIQGSVPAAVGIRHGCAYDSPGFGHAILEKLRKGHWRGRAGLPHHPLVPKRIHWREGEVPNQGASSAIHSTLGCACPLFLHHVGRSHIAGASSALLFVTVPRAIQHVTWLLVDQRAVLRNHSRDIVDSGAGGDVYPVGAARRCVMVDWMVRRGIQLNSNRQFAILTLTFALLAIFTHTFIHKLCDSKSRLRY